MKAVRHPVTSPPGDTTTRAMAVVDPAVDRLGQTKLPNDQATGRPPTTSNG
ncbi:MAG: hypothetical protein OEM32_08340 [Acidimicrobiia bacterium]|nr:hypothetical protein [Acidimicrobiia bacterium]